MIQYEATSDGAIDEAGNLLDLIIAPDTNNDDVKDVPIHSLCFSDHSLVCCQLAFKRQQPEVLYFFIPWARALGVQCFIDNPPPL